MLVRNVPWRSKSDRIFDRPLSLEAGGTSVKTTLSDHFGILATIDAK